MRIVLGESFSSTRSTVVASLKWDIGWKDSINNAKRTAMQWTQQRDRNKTQQKNTINVNENELLNNECSGYTLKRNEKRKLIDNELLLLKSNVRNETKQNQVKWKLKQQENRERKKIKNNRKICYTLKIFASEWVCVFWFFWFAFAMKNDTWNEKLD